MDQRDVVVITGSSGNIGTATINRLAEKYRLAGFDEPGPPYSAQPAVCVAVDMASQESIEKGLQSVREKFGDRIASVIHLAGYYSFSGEPSPKYYTVNVLGTRHLLDALQAFEVEQFVFASTMLVYRPTEPGRPINEEWPLEPKWDYPKSKTETEAVITARHNKIPYVNLRLAGVYADDCLVPSIANQIQLIYERQLISHVFPGDLTHGQTFLHIDDLVDAFSLVVARRKQLPTEFTVNIGEPVTYSYGMVQHELGRVIHGEEWDTRQIPKAVAKTGAWLEEVALPKDKEPFIKPWMIDLADDHYELDITLARTTLAWQPKRRLIDTLPEMVRRLKEDPPAWYQANKLLLPDEMQPQAALKPDSADVPTHHDKKKSASHAQTKTKTKHGVMSKEKGAHDDQKMLIDEHLSTLWPHFISLVLGLWLIASPFALGYLSTHTPDPGIVRVMLERNLSSPESRNLLMTWSDVISGGLIVILAYFQSRPSDALAGHSGPMPPRGSGFCWHRSCSGHRFPPLTTTTRWSAHW
jgi:nucleoside-diphosphate-sugar epimerase